MPSIVTSRKRMNPMSRRLSPHASSRTARDVGPCTCWMVRLAVKSATRVGLVP